MVGEATATRTRQEVEVVDEQALQGTRAIRRQVYLATLAGVAPVLLLFAWLNRAEVTAIPVNLTLFVVVAVVFLGLVTRRMSVEHAEITVVACVTTVVLMRLAYVAAVAPVPLDELRRLTAETIGPTTVAIVLVVYLALDLPRARWWALAVWTVFSTLLVVRLAQDWAEAVAGGTFVALARQSATLAVVAGLAYALASLKSQLADARARSFELVDLANTDVLTGTRNRRGVEDVLREQLARTARYPAPLSVAVIDLDRFKECNDHHGHAAGDAALIAVVSSLAGELRTTDALGRWGGDELLVVAPETGSIEVARSAERWRRVVADLRLAAGDAIITASIGVATRRPGDDLDSLLTRADGAMYAAKRAGGNRVVTDVEAVVVDVDAGEPDPVPALSDRPDQMAT